MLFASENWLGEICRGGEFIAAGICRCGICQGGFVAGYFVVGKFAVDPF
jgi:hypothetical protein